MPIFFLLVGALALLIGLHYFNRWLDNASEEYMDSLRASEEHED
jgi:hypothetical protein